MNQLKLNEMNLLIEVRYQNEKKHILSEIQKWNHSETYKLDFCFDKLLGYK